MPRLGPLSRWANCGSIGYSHSKRDLPSHYEVGCHRESPRDADVAGASGQVRRTSVGGSIGPLIGVTSDCRDVLRKLDEFVRVTGAVRPQPLKAESRLSSMNRAIRFNKV
jgi:hypothetical protein